MISAMTTIVCAGIAGAPAIYYARASLRQSQRNAAAQLVTSDKADSAAASAGIAATKAEAAATMMQVASDKTDQVIAGNEKIHELVNSGSDKMKLEILALKAELVRANERTDKLATTIDQMLTSRVVTGHSDPVQVEVMNTPLSVIDRHTDPKD